MDIHVIHHISHSLRTFVCITFFFHFSFPMFPLIDTFGGHVVLASATISDKIQKYKTRMSQALFFLQLL